MMQESSEWIQYRSGTTGGEREQWKNAVKVRNKWWCKKSVNGCRIGQEQMVVQESSGWMQCRLGTIGGAREQWNDAV